MKKSWLYEVFRMLPVTLFILIFPAWTSGFPEVRAAAGQFATSVPIPQASIPSEKENGAFDRQNLEFLSSDRLFFQEVASGLSNPLFIAHAGDASGRLFVLERAGRIRILKNGSLLSTPFLNIVSSIKSSEGEQGLLGLAFHPSFETNGQFFVAYTAPRSGDPTGSNLVLQKYTILSGNPDQADPNSGAVVLSIPHPIYSNHNGGTLAFGQDGYLYWSTGDGGGAGDPNNNAQNLDSLLGKILRIDIDADSAAYGIPATNPFFSSTDPNIRKEIWAYGLRNPWRISFDRLTHNLYIADVGQSAREEVNFQSAESNGGENYGWRVMEGSLCYNPSSGCNQSGITPPVAEYSHTLGCSITGGYTYRGSNYPSLYGYYFYGDFCTGNFFNLHNSPETGWTANLMAATPYQISTFGEDEQGELYLADYRTGKIYAIGYQELSLDTTGVYRPDNGALYLKNSNTSGFADITIHYGQRGDYPVVGDWDGDGDTTIGVYRDGLFYLRNSNTIGVADVVFAFGSPGDQPIAGDWNGDGIDTIGVYRNGTFFLRNSNATSLPDNVFALGIPGDVGIAGDWNGDGIDTTGVFRPSNGALYLKNTNATGFADIQINYGLPGDKPITGDWNNDGVDTIGIYRNGTFMLRNSNTIGFAEIVFGLGVSGDMPIAGNWDGLP